MFGVVINIQLNELLHPFFSPEICNLQLNLIFQFVQFLLLIVTE